MKNLLTVKQNINIMRGYIPAGEVHSMASQRCHKNMLIYRNTGEILVEPKTQKVKNTGGRFHKKYENHLEGIERCIVKRREIDE